MDGSGGGWRCVGVGRHAVGEGFRATELGRRAAMEGHAGQGKRNGVRRAVGVGSRATGAAKAWSWGATSSGRASTPLRQAVTPLGGPP